MLGTKAVVIDNGSGWMKAGFAGDDMPRHVFPSVVGRPRHPGASNPAMGILVGDEAIAKRGLLTLRYPIDQGRLVDWDGMEHLWRHAFTALGVSPGNQPLLITQFSLWSAKDVDRLIAIMFGTFGVPAIYVGGEAALTLLALGKHTGAMISIGDSQSRAACVHAGVELPTSYHQIDEGGQHVTDYLRKIMTERNYSFTTMAEREVVRDIREKLCYIAADFRVEMEAAAASSELERDYPLSDGGVVTLGNERFRAPEALFRPSLIGQQWEGIDKQVHGAIAHSPAELRNDLYGNILLAGGNAKIPGLAERMKRELTGLAPSGVDIRITVPQEPAYAAWKGGSLLASSSGFEHKLLKKEEYDESGTAMLHATREQEVRRILAPATAGTSGARLQTILPHHLASTLWFDDRAVGQVKLKNISDRAIAGHLHILFAGVPDMVYFQSFSGTTRTDVARGPYVTVPDTTSLAPGQSVVIRFQLLKGASPITHAALTTEICIGGLD